MNAAARSGNPAKRAQADNRPSLAKKPTRKEREKQNSIMEDGVRLDFGDGQFVQVQAGDLNAFHARALRREVGVTFPGLVAVLQSSYFDIDMVAALMWLRRIIDGEDVSYEEVAKSVGYDIMENMKMDDAEPDQEGVLDPEA